MHRERDWQGRRSIRLKGYDYASAGAYFITVCTQNRECLFGEIIVRAGPFAGPAMNLNNAGRMITTIWHQIPDHYPDIDIDEFMVMPNHFHGIIIVGAGYFMGNHRDTRKGNHGGLPLRIVSENDAGIVGAGPCACPENHDQPQHNNGQWQPQFENGQPHQYTPGQPQGVAPTGLSLPDIVHRFKTMTTKQYADGVNQFGWQPFEGKLWQRNYYEHIIRDDEELNAVRQYIRDNPLKWESDSENPSNLKAKR